MWRDQRAGAIQLSLASETFTPCAARSRAAASVPNHAASARSARDGKLIIVRRQPSCGAISMPSILCKTGYKHIGAFPQEGKSTGRGWICVPYRGGCGTMMIVHVRLLGLHPLGARWGTGQPLGNMTGRERRRTKIAFFGHFDSTNFGRENEKA